MFYASSSAYLAARDRLKTPSSETVEMFGKNVTRHPMDLVREGDDVWSDYQKHRARRHDADQAAKQGGISHRDRGNFTED